MFLSLKKKIENKHNIIYFNITLLIILQFFKLLIKFSFIFIERLILFLDYMIFLLLNLVYALI